MAVYVLGTDPHDLVPLAMTEAAGFKPAATLLVRNQHFGRAEAFGDVIRHSAYQAALARGAVQVWMPALNEAASVAVNARALHFTQVADKLGPYLGACVRSWLSAMGEAMAPVSSWLP